MWQGNDGNSFQASTGTLTAEKKDYGADNLRLVRIAQGEDSVLAERAMSEIVEKNEGLVRSIALKFRDRGVDMEDLLQIGTIGVVKAVRSFDTIRSLSLLSSL